LGKPDESGVRHNYVLAQKNKGVVNLLRREPRNCAEKKTELGHPHFSFSLPPFCFCPMLSRLLILSIKQSTLCRI